MSRSNLSQFSLGKVLKLLSKAKLSQILEKEPQNYSNMALGMPQSGKKISPKMPVAADGFPEAPGHKNIATLTDEAKEAQETMQFSHSPENTELLKKIDRMQQEETTKSNVNQNHSIDNGVLSELMNRSHQNSPGANPLRTSGKGVGFNSSTPNNNNRGR
jgi:hypothetical protein